MRPLRIEPLEERCVPTTITPKTFDDGGPGSGSLRDAVLQCNDDKSKEDCTILLQAGTYSLTIRNTDNRQENAALTGDLDVTSTAHRLIIHGEGADTVIDAGKLQDRVFQIVNPKTQVVFQNLVIRGGLARDDGSAGALPGTTTSRGGAILNNGGDVTLENVVITNNAARGGSGRYFGLGAQGGGLYSAGGSLMIASTTIATNTGRGGEGVEDGGGGGTSQGGGLYASAALLTISGSTIASNHSIGGNGRNGFRGDMWDPSRPSSCAGGSGGAGGASQGGGLYTTGGMLAISNSTISTSTVRGGDGGNGGDEGNPGYLCPAGNGGNGGPGFGGAIYLAGAGTLAVTSGTVAFNTSETSTGGEGGKGQIPGNPGRDGAGQGGGMRNDGGTVSARNTLFGNNTATSHPDVSGAFASAFYNLLSDGTGSNLVDGVDGNLVGWDPLLGPLEDNGGPILTHALLPGSPALDAGDPTDAPEWDQRGEGYSRIAGANIDIGAYEEQDPGRSPRLDTSLGVLFLELPSRRHSLHGSTWWGT